MVALFMILAAYLGHGGAHPGWVTPSYIRHHLNYEFPRKAAHAANIMRANERAGNQPVQVPGAPGMWEVKGRCDADPTTVILTPYWFELKPVRHC